MQNKHATQPYRGNGPGKYPDQEIGAGIVIPINVTDGSIPGHFILAANTFRGVNAPMGGSCKEGTHMDEYFYQTAAREFREEFFVKLVEMDDDALKTELQRVGFSDSEIEELSKDIRNLGKTSLYQKLKLATTEEALQTADLSENNGNHSKRKTYVISQIDATQTEVDEYLTCMTKIAGTMFDKLAEHRSNQHNSTGTPESNKFKDYKDRIADYAESREFGLIRSIDVKALIALRNNRHNEIPQGHSITNQRPPKITGRRRPVWGCTLYCAGGEQKADLDMFDASLGPLTSAFSEFIEKPAQPQPQQPQQNIFIQALNALWKCIKFILSPITKKLASSATNLAVDSNQAQTTVKPNVIVGLSSELTTARQNDSNRNFGR